MLTQQHIHCINYSVFIIGFIGIIIYELYKSYKSNA